MPKTVLLLCVVLGRSFGLSFDYYHHLLIERDELEVPSLLNSLFDGLLASALMGAQLVATQLDSKLLRALLRRTLASARLRSNCETVTKT